MREQLEDRGCASLFPQSAAHSTSQMTDGITRPEPDAMRLIEYFSWSDADRIRTLMVTCAN